MKLIAFFSVSIFRKYTIGKYPHNPHKRRLVELVNPYLSGKRREFFLKIVAYQENDFYLPRLDPKTPNCSYFQTLPIHNMEVPVV